MKALAEIKLTPADYDTFKPYFPNTVHELITVCGITATFALLTQHSGQRLDIGKNQSKNGKILFKKLAAIVGEPAAHKITLAYAIQRKIYVPRCQKIRRMKRDLLIKAEFDELSKHQAANEFINSLTEKYGVSERHIWRILKT